MAKMLTHTREDDCRLALQRLVPWLVLLLVSCAQDFGEGDARSIDHSAGQALYADQCASCHGPSGEGGSGGALIACATCGSEESLVAKIERDMPSANNPLQGQDATDVALYILDEFNGSTSGQVARSLPGVATLSPNEAIYKIAFELAGRLPTEAEIATFSSDLSGEREVVMSYMDTDYFYERLKDMLNDTLLTDAWRTENEPDRRFRNLYRNVLEVDVSGGPDYSIVPDLDWENGYKSENSVKTSYAYLYFFSSEAVTRKPLLLAEFIARNNRDFREFVSAKYTVANRFSFEAFNNGDYGPGNMRVVDPDGTENYGALPLVENVEWKVWSSQAELLDYLDVVTLYKSPASNSDIIHNYILDGFAYDPRDIKAVQLYYNDSTGRPLNYGVPHSGILTDELFLQTYTGADTNMHRTRANMVYWFFAAKDLLAIEGNRDEGDLELNFANTVGVNDPTATNEDCVVCHEVLDPVAKAFENYSLDGIYDTTNFDDVPEHDDSIGWGLSASNFQSSGANGYNNRELQWLGEQIANDAAYPKGIAQMLVRAMTGQQILGQPDANSPDSYVQAYQLQSDLITKSASEFAASGFNIKDLIYAITKSAYYRADDIFYADMAADYPQLGSIRYLPPQLLNQKLRALNSGGWNDSLNLYDLSSRKFMGGKDTNEVLVDADSVSGIISAVTERMAVEESCDIVRTEFDLADTNDRFLFTLVDDTTNMQAVSANGRLAQTSAIRAQIARLYLAMLHKEVDANSAEIDIAVDLFSDVLSDEADSTCDVIGGTDTVADDGQYSQGEVREAWYAVLVYIMMDYRFIYG